MLYDWCEPDQASHVVIYMLLLNRYVCLLFVCPVLSVRYERPKIKFQSLHFFFRIESQMVHSFLFSFLK